MLLVLFPVLLRAVGWPATIRTFKLYCLRLCLRMCMYTIVVPYAHRTRCKTLYGFTTRTNGGERRLGERMEEVVLGEDGFLLLLVLGRKRLFEPGEYCTLLRARPTSLQTNPTAEQGRLTME